MYVAVGECFETPTLEEFIQLWTGLFAHSPSMRLTWKKLTGKAMASYSDTGGEAGGKCAIRSFCSWVMYFPFCCRKVLIGRKVVLMPRWDRTRLMASEVPLMYGIVAEVVTLGGCERGAGSCEGWEWR